MWGAVGWLLCRLVFLMLAEAKSSFSSGSDGCPGVRRLVGTAALVGQTIPGRMPAEARAVRGDIVRPTFRFKWFI
jgi:hypothetical protein